MYEKFLKIHGKTHDYKISYSGINRAFLLFKPDGNTVCYVIALNNPVRIGQAQHYYLCMQFPKDKAIQIQLNLEQKEIADKYGDEIDSEMNGPLFEVLSRLFKAIAGTKIVKPDEETYKSHRGAQAIKCSNKANDGYLYPLTQSFIFINKPVCYTRHSDISHIELSRIQEFQSSTGRTFDMTIVLKDGTNQTFGGIDKDEFGNFLSYMHEKKLTARNMDDGGKKISFEGVNNYQNIGKRNANVEMGEELDDEEVESEDDESFQDDSAEQDEDFSEDGMDEEDEPKPKKKGGSKKKEEEED